MSLGNIGKIGKFGNYSHIGELTPNTSKTACNVVKCVYVIQNVASGRKVPKWIGR